MMDNCITDNETQQANRIIAFEVINERLGVAPNENNVTALANCITQLEKSAESPCPRGEASC